LDSVFIHARVNCLGSDTKAELEPGIPFVCAPGEGMEVILYEPNKPGQWGRFSLTEIRQVDESRAAPTLTSVLRQDVARKVGDQFGALI
jgi:hypothetical protein